MTNSQDPVFVIFGTGPLGLAVMRRLVATGKRVRIVNRSGQAEVPEGVEVIGANAADPVSARRACEGAAVVFHCASGAYGRWPETLPAIMNGIIEGAAAAGARLVYGDNLYMYGPVSGPMTEDLPNRPVGPTTAVRAQVATTLIEAHTNGKVRATIGRASDFYGPQVHQSKVGDGVFARALSGRPAQVLGDPDAPHTYTFIDDFAAGLVTLAEREEALGQVWHIPSAETMSTRQFIETVFEEVGTPMRLQAPPKLAITLLAVFSPFMRAAKETLYQSERPFVMDHSKYARTFGSSPTPHGQGIAETLKWFRQHSPTSR
jgi:nucleoside-diphosphate-sugar epimerase